MSIEFGTGHAAHRSGMECFPNRVGQFVQDGHDSSFMFGERGRRKLSCGAPYSRFEERIVEINYTSFTQRQCSPSNTTPEAARTSFKSKRTLGSPSNSRFNRRAAGQCREAQVFWLDAQQHPDHRL